MIVFYGDADAENVEQTKSVAEYTLEIYIITRRRLAQPDLLNMLFMSVYGACFTFKDKPVRDLYILEIAHKSHTATAATTTPTTGSMTT